MFEYFVSADPPGKKLLVRFNEYAKKHMMSLELDVVSVYCNTCILQQERLRLGSLMLDSCRLIFERSHFERSENEFFRSRFSDLLELNSCAKLQN